MEQASILDIRAWLDEALVALAGAGESALPLDEAERAIGLALRSTYQAIAGLGDAATYRDRVRSAREQARDALSLLRAFDPTATDLPAVARPLHRAVRALDAPLAIAPDERPELPRPGRRVPRVQATVDVAALLEPQRDVLLPVVLLPDRPPRPPDPDPPAPPPPPIRTLAELEARMAEDAARSEAAESASDAEPLAGRDTDPGARPESRPDRAAAARALFGVQRSREQILRGHAEALLEDLSTLGLCRRPRRLETWYAPNTERRLLTKVDAIVACGDFVIAPLVKQLEGRPLPDPELTWAVLFMLGSLAGDDALDQIRRVVVSCPLEPLAVRASVVDALALAPHPRIDGLARGWLGSSDAILRELGVRVLSRRRALSAAEAQHAARDGELRVRLFAAIGLGHALGQVPNAAFSPLLREDDERVVAAAIRASLLRRAAIGAERALGLVRAGKGPFADAVTYLALSGGGDAIGPLREDAATGGSPALLRALGWYGSTELVPYQIGRLESEDPAIKEAALDGLYRLFGVPLTDEAPDPTFERGEEPFERRPRGAEPPPLDLTGDPEVWSALWQKYRKHARPGVRYRNGHVCGSLDALRLLEDPRSCRRDRQLSHLDLVVRTGVALPFEPSQWIPRQRQQLSALREHLASRLELTREGAWPTRFAS